MHTLSHLLRRRLLLVAFGFIALLLRPSGLAQNPPGQIDVPLTWNPNPESDVAGYRLYLRTALTGYGPGMDVGNVTTMIVPNLAVGSLYYLRVTAYNTAGFESAPSPEILYQAIAPTSPTPTPTPITTATPAPTSTPTPPAPTPIPTPSLTPTPNPTPGPSVTPIPTPTPAIGLVAAYNFNEGSGTNVTDASGHNIPGTVEGAEWTTGGRYGAALLFDGTTSYVDLGNPSLLQMTGSMTWSAWMKSAINPSQDSNLIAKADDSSGWQLQTTRDTGPRTFGIAVSGAPNQFAERYSTSTRLVGIWYHVAGVYDATAGTLDVYINGVLDNGVLRGTVPPSQVSPAVNVNIGRRSGGLGFNGVIDEVRIYNRALSAEEIQADMNTPIVAQ